MAKIHRNCINCLFNTYEISSNLKDQNESLINRNPFFTASLRIITRFLIHPLQDLQLVKEKNCNA